jgi:LacI family transcriptional regulator
MVNQGHATIFDVAELAEVSIATVSRVMNSPNLVRPATRIKVLSAINELSYVPRGRSGSNTRKRSGRVGILTPSFTNSPAVQIIAGITQALAGTAVDVVIYPVVLRESVDDFLEKLLLNDRLRGVIIVMMPVTGRLTFLLQANEIQAVLIGNHHPSISGVEIDNALGGRMAAEYLLKKGHRRIAVAYPAKMDEFSSHRERQRQEAFIKTLAEHDIPITKEYICPIQKDIDDAREKITSLLDLQATPTALFATSDHLALQILNTIRDCGFQTPGDVAVIGFGDIDASTHVGLTTISQSLYQSGRMAVDLLLRRLEEPSRPVQNINLQLKVVERETA